MANEPFSSEWDRDVSEAHITSQRVMDATPEAGLRRISELAAKFGAEQASATARSVADRIAEGRFYLACVGQFKRGKSTLLNALIGHPALPTGVVPVTSVPTVVRYGRSLSARVRIEGQDWITIPTEAVAEYVSEEKNPENAKRVVGLEIFVPCKLLTAGMCLVDTPGLGSVFGGNTAATHAFVPHVDAALILIGADPPVSGEELELVEIVAQQVRDLVFVLNKADRVTAAEREAAMKFAREILRERLQRDVPKILQVSALESSSGSRTRDWEELVQSIDDLSRQSGRTLVPQAAVRMLKRTGEQVLGAVREEREALLRPLEDSERHVATLKCALGQAEAALRDLGALLGAEQQRICGVFTERRRNFLKVAQPEAGKELDERLRGLRVSGNGPGYRRAINHLAQQVAREQLGPWLESEGKYAEEAFRKLGNRFVELANGFLHRLEQSSLAVPGELPDELTPEQKLRVRSQFYLHAMEERAAPASPILFMVDLVCGVLGISAWVIRDGHDFLQELLEVNSSRVESDVEERVRESRRRLEREIQNVLREATAVAARALARARVAQSAGAESVQAALSELKEAEDELRSLINLAP